MLVTLIGIGIFVVDMGHLNATKSNLQNAADSASFAGALRLRVGRSMSEQDGVLIPHLKELSKKFAELNHPAAGILASADIQVGRWDFVKRTFTTTPPSEANAVRVSVRRGGSQSEKVPLLLAPFFGAGSTEIDSLSVSAFDTLTDAGGNQTFSMPYIVQ
jgi:uncharacterized membrane protein